MQTPVISSALGRTVRDVLLEKILRQCGAYYQSGDLFYQRLWQQRLSHIGFRVISVEKLPYHHELWFIRCYVTLAAQSYLLLTMPVSKPHFYAKDRVLKQLQAEIRRMAKDLGATIQRDCIHVGRKGAYLRITFIWPLGQPGRWVKEEKRAEPFSFLIRPWVRRNRN
jgi:hypothetical protein